jgi:uncharacterized membrane protein YgcG
VAEGCKIGRRHVKTLMQRMGIEALYRRPRTAKPEPGHKIYPYLLRGLEITRPNQVWAMDITYIPMARGFVYLAVVLDWFSRHVLSWRLSINEMTRNRKLEASRFKARCLVIGAVLAVHCLATPGLSGLILFAAETSAKAKSGSGAGHGSSGSSGHSNSAHSSGSSGTSVHGTIGNVGASNSVVHPTPTPAGSSIHGGHSPCAPGETSQHCP